MSLERFEAALDLIVADNTTGHENFNEAEKAQMMAWCPTACAMAGELRRLALQAETLNEMWNNGVAAAVSRLKNNDVLPNPTDLAGVTDLVHTTDTDSDWIRLAEAIRQPLAGNADPDQVDLSGDAVLATFVKAAGINIQG